MLYVYPIDYNCAIKQYCVDHCAQTKNKYHIKTKHSV